jgi:nitrilase
LLVRAAAAEGAQLIVLPEYFGILGAHATGQACVPRSATAPGRSRISLPAWHAKGASPSWAAACRLPATILRGCAARAWSTVPDGARIARYDKIHLFRFTSGAEDYDETRTIQPGDAVMVFDAPCGRVGLSICYDVRFPELYRALGDCALILVPAAFTATTGAAHWELLLRTRAVENQCYVLAAAQGGLHPNGRRTWGHSMLVDPWGAVVASKGEGPGIVVGEVDPARIAEARAKLPALTHRVM